MRPSEGVQHKATVICPSDEDLKDRIIQRTDMEGKDVPDHVVLEVKANLPLSHVGDPPDEGPSSIESQWEEADKLEGLRDGRITRLGHPQRLPGPRGWWHFPRL